jgi:hypothetical protein
MHTHSVHQKVQQVPSHCWWCSVLQSHSLHCTLPRNIYEISTKFQRKMIPLSFCIIGFRPSLSDLSGVFIHPSVESIASGSANNYFHVAIVICPMSIMCSCSECGLMIFKMYAIYFNKSKKLISEFNLGGMIHVQVLIGDFHFKMVELKLFKKPQPTKCSKKK